MNYAEQVQAEGRGDKHLRCSNDGCHAVCHALQPAEPRPIVAGPLRAWRLSRWPGRLPHAACDRVGASLEEVAARFRLIAEGRPETEILQRPGAVDNRKAAACCQGVFEP